MISVSPQIIARTTPLLDYLKKKRENERLMKTFEIASTFLFISFFTMVAIKPALTTISSLVGEIKSKEILTKAMKSKIDQVIQAQDTFASIQERYPIVNSSLPDSERYSQALVQVVGSATTAGSVVDKVQFQTQILDTGKADPTATYNPLAKNIKQYSLAFNNLTDFPSALRLLTNLRNDRRLFTIQNITINPNQDAATKDKDPNKLSFKVNLTTYYWSQPVNEKK